MEGLAYFRNYMPMIKMLRTKGLEGGHWSSIAVGLKMRLDRAKMNLFGMIAKGMDKQDNLDVIKGISDQAARENSVKQALENLEQEAKEIEFEFVYASEFDST